MKIYISKNKPRLGNPVYKNGSKEFLTNTFFLLTTLLYLTASESYAAIIVISLTFARYLIVDNFFYRNSSSFKRIVFHTLEIIPLLISLSVFPDKVLLTTLAFTALFAIANHLIFKSPLVSVSTKHLVFFFALTPLTLIVIFVESIALF